MAAEESGLGFVGFRFPRKPFEVRADPDGLLRRHDAVFENILQRLHELRHLGVVCFFG